MDTTQLLNNNNTAGKWQNSDGNPVLLKAKVFPAALHIKPLQRMSTLTGKAKVSFPWGADVRAQRDSVRSSRLGCTLPSPPGADHCPSGRVKPV